MEIIVEDTDIIIDLYNTGLVSICQDNGYTFHTSRFVLEVLDRDEHAEVVKVLMERGVLVIDDFKGQDLVQLLQTVYECQDKDCLSTSDYSVLMLAERHNCELLTTSKKLKLYAEQRGIVVNDLSGIKERLLKHYSDNQNVCLPVSPSPNVHTIMYQ